MIVNIYQTNLINVWTFLRHTPGFSVVFPDTVVRPRECTPSENSCTLRTFEDAAFRARPIGADCRLDWAGPLLLFAIRLNRP